MKIFIYLSNFTKNLVEAWGKHLENDQQNKINSSHLLFPEVAYDSSLNVYSHGAIALSGPEQSARIKKCLSDSNNIDNLVIATHSEIIFSVLRCEIKAGRITPDNFEVRWINPNMEMITIKSTKDGRLVEWPTEMFSEYEKLLMELL
jgi:hypothetical protein